MASSSSSGARKKQKIEIELLGLAGCTKTALCKILSKLSVANLLDEDVASQNERSVKHALSVASKKTTSTNTAYGTLLQKMRIGIEKGETISRMARSTKLFPPLVVQMIVVGEEIGNIGDMLLEVADFYEMEVDAELKNMASVIEPVLIVIIGMMVLVLALGIFLPMWNLSSAMR